MEGAKNVVTSKSFKQSLSFILREFGEIMSDSEKSAIRELMRKLEPLDLNTVKE
jgi:hypothetical protein